MATLADWLGHNHHIALERTPDEWDGCAFWVVDTDGGRRLVLAPDEDYAAPACARNTSSRSFISVNEHAP